MILNLGLQSHCETSTEFLYILHPVPHDYLTFYGIFLQLIKQY